MTVQHVTDELSDYLDGAAESPSAIEAHLSRCSDCRGELADLRQVVKMLGTLPELVPPKNFFIDDLMLARRRRARRNQSAGWVVRSIGAAAAVLMLFAVGGDVSGTFLNGGSGNPSVVNTVAVDAARPQIAGAVLNEASSNRSATSDTSAAAAANAVEIKPFDAMPFRVAEAGALVLLLASGGVLYYLRR
jgi:predicted anti-sigma-YlaC factor YlaD